MKVAGKLAETTGHELSREVKKKGGLIVHSAFGTGMGALYGTMMELGPRDLRRHALASGIGFSPWASRKNQRRPRCRLTFTLWLRMERLSSVG
jgi:hypothetical protein